MVARSLGFRPRPTVEAHTPTDSNRAPAYPVRGRETGEVECPGVERRASRDRRAVRTGDGASNGQSSTMPFLIAKWISSALVWRFSASIIWYLWNSTVRVEISRRAAISFADRPSARRWRTSR